MWIFFFFFNLPVIREDTALEQVLWGGGTRLVFVSSSYADSYRGRGSETLTSSSGGKGAVDYFLGRMRREMRLERKRSTRCPQKLERLMLRAHSKPAVGSGTGGVGRSPGLGQCGWSERLLGTGEVFKGSAGRGALCIQVPPHQQNDGACSAATVIHHY